MTIVSVLVFIIVLIIQIFFFSTVSFSLVVALVPGRS
jgi:hypothetical protein